MRDLEIVLCFVFSILLGSIITLFGAYNPIKEKIYSENFVAPKETKYIMWLEECPACGGEVECDYSVAVDEGYKDCKSCGSTIKFTKDDEAYSLSFGE